MADPTKSLLDDLRERLCMNLIKDGTHLCVKEVNHTGPCGETISQHNLLVALRNRRLSLEHDQMHPERIKEISDIIDMITAWQDPPV